MQKVVVVVLLTLLSLAQAQTVQPTTDTTSTGMGGAFVGFSPFNPANLGFQGNFLFVRDNRPSTDSTRDEGKSVLFQAIYFNDYTISGTLLNNLDILNDMVERNSGLAQFQQRFQTNTPGAVGIQDAAQLAQSMSQLTSNRSGGAFQEISAYFDVFFQNIGFYFSIWGHAGAHGVLDNEHLALENVGNILGNANQVWDQTATAHSLSPGAQSLANEIQNDLGGAGVISNNQAGELAFQAMESGANVDDPLFRNLYRQIILNTYRRNATIDQNTSGYVIRSITFGELNLSYGQALLENILAFGINIKAVEVRLSEEYVTLGRLENGNTILNSLFDYVTDKDRIVQRFNIDLGCTLRPLPGLSIGLYAKNLIPYSYRYPSGETVDIHTQFRAGASYSYEDYITIAVDIDLNRIHYDTVQGYRARNIGGGFQFSPVSKQFPFGVLLRFGALKNLEDEQQDGLFTSGLSFQYWKLSLDINGAVSFARVQIQSGEDEIKTQERASFSVALTFQTNF